MPKACDPNATFDIVLPCDRSKPKETQPTFVARYLSWGEIKRQIDKAEPGPDGVLDLIAQNLAGWKNISLAREPNADPVPLPFSRENLEAVLTAREAEVLWISIVNGDAAE